MLRATTLVHKGAMPIALHSISSFARLFGHAYELVIHTDPSVSDDDCRLLLSAASGIRSEIVKSDKRKEFLATHLNGFNDTRKLMERGSYFNKLEVAMMETPPYFYFDSDTLWIKYVEDFRPPHAHNAFSTETWTSYPGIARPSLWVKTKTPQRVNSGFYYISEPFPYEKLEDLLAKAMFDSTGRFANDQEIFAYLYNNMEYFHPEDLKRGRFGSVYKLDDLECAAIHFPGGMWRSYLGQIERMTHVDDKGPLKMRFLPAVPITRGEILHMRIRTKVGDSKLLHGPLNVLRSIRRMTTGNR